MARNDFHTAQGSLPPQQVLGRGIAMREEQVARPAGNLIDLRGLLIEHSENVELVPIHTNNMRASGLLHGGMAIVDRKALPRLGTLTAVRFNGIVIIRRLEKRNGQFCLVSDDPREEILYTEGADIERLGNVIWALFKT